MSTPPPRIKPGHAADADAAGRRDAVRQAERRWWRRSVSVLRHPRPVFVALRDDDEDDVVARQEPIFAIVVLAGVGGIVLTPAWGTLSDDPTVDWIVVAVLTFVGGLFYGAFGYVLLGLAVWLGARGVGVLEPARKVRHVVAFSAVPLALSSLVTLPAAIIAFGGDFFRTGGADDGAGHAVVVGVGLAFVAWTVALLVLGLRTTFGLPWRGVAGALALTGVLVAAFAVVPSVL
jgi:Yip1 domain